MNKSSNEDEGDITAERFVKPTYGRDKRHSENKSCDVDLLPTPPSSMSQAAPSPSPSSVGTMSQVNEIPSANSTSSVKYQQNGDSEDKKAYGSLSVLEYFPIDIRDRSKPLKENPLSEIGWHWDARYPISARLRANFPRGEIIAAAGHSLSRPSLRAVNTVNSVFQKVNANLHAIHWPDNQNSPEEKIRSDYAYKLHLHQEACTTLSKLLGCKREDNNLGNGLSDDLIRLN